MQHSESSPRQPVSDAAVAASDPGGLRKPDTTAATLAAEPAPPRASRGKYLWLAAAALLAAWWFLAGGKPAEPAPQYLTALAEVGDIENSVTATGKLEPSEYVNVGAQVSGQLEKLHVDIGDTVRTGDLLAEIDAAVQANIVEASRANLASLTAQLAARESAVSYAQSRVERQTRMLENKATSQQNYDDAIDQLTAAQSNLSQLRSQIAQAKATLGSDEATLGYSRIYAPMDGTIIGLPMKEGQTLNATQSAPTILRIGQLTTMKVEADVSEADVSKLTLGMEAYFTTLGSGLRRWTSTLRQILPMPSVENNVVLYKALFDIDNADGALLAGMTAQVFFVVASARNVLIIPVAALDRPRQGEPDEQPPVAVASEPPMPAAPALRGRAATVSVVNADGSISDRAVQIGVSNRIYAEVLSGLQEGESVIIGIVDTASGKNGPHTP